MTSMQGQPAADAAGVDGGDAARRECWAGSCDAVFSWCGLLRRGVPMGALSAVVVGIPTDVIPNALFSRMTPVRWWDYVVLALTAVMTVLWFATAAHRTGARVPAATLLSLLAVGCPVCNKMAVALLGVSGALSLWAPLQPLLAALSLFLAGTALWSRMVVVHRAAARSREAAVIGVSAERHT
ncbi:hypothetical protein [Pseudonocardia sp. KRD291]|uniref:hypothetical protein n=1 Tax=Pseudonocardia sp. KRD291 TaxID=2792007 RepID=UPI001C4A4AD6|nr:hypothetical protein [Pseudonocardia sp. KRD291]MBW0106385.1 hypothetical protein [Pseudonocardia sp. KRD291]